MVSATFYVPELPRLNYMEVSCIVVDDIKSVIDYESYLDREYLVGRSDVLLKPWVDESPSSVDESPVNESPVNESPAEIVQNTPESHDAPVNTDFYADHFIDPVDVFLHRFLYLVSSTYCLRGSSKRQEFLREFRNHLALHIDTNVQCLSRLKKQVQTALWRIMDQKQVERYVRNMKRSNPEPTQSVPEMNTEEDVERVAEYVSHRFKICIRYQKRIAFYYPNRYVVDLDDGTLISPMDYRDSRHYLHETKIHVGTMNLAELKETARTLGLRVKNAKKSDYVTTITQHLKEV